MTEKVTVPVTTPEDSVRYASCTDEVKALIKGRAPIIWVLTHEENRFIEEFTDKVAPQCKRQVWIWSAYQGLVRQENMLAIVRATGDEKDTHNPQKALARIADMGSPDETTGLVFILRDFHTVLGEPIPRQIRDMYDHMVNNGKTLIITSPVLAHGPGGTKSGLPVTLEKQISVVTYELPNKPLIMDRVDEVIDYMKENAKGTAAKENLNYNNESRDQFCKALQGLTMLEVDNALSTSITHLQRLDVQKLINDKRQIIRKSDILEFIDAPVGLSDVGGLDRAKTYLSRYAKAYTDEAREFGVEPLKGMILTGVPGTGKSLLAKAIGKLWAVPLLKLDVGKVMTGLVGGSEGKMRQVINQTEAMAPCVLWIDEVDKGLSGTKSSNFSDGGTMARVFGTLLTAMQDGMEGVTIIATANNIAALPPEFIRRFNEVFFVDLPGPDERWEIFGIHMEKRNRDIAQFEDKKDELLKASEDYTGAEIEKAVKDAIAAAFYASKKDVDSGDVLMALEDTKPISMTMEGQVKKIREKARGHFRFASTWAEEQVKKGRKVKSAKGRKISLNDALDDMPEFTKTTKEKQAAITAKAAEEQTKKKNRFRNVTE